MHDEPQKRFRKRGGAKKKKKNRELLPTTENERSAVPSSETANHASHYFSGFSAPTYDVKRLDEDIQNYLLKLQDELESLDPGAEIASSWHPSGSEDVPASILLARNALRELSSRVNEVARDNSGSRIMEALMSYAKDAEVLVGVLEAILDCGSSRFVDLATHRTGSHTVETVIHALRLTSSAENLPVFGRLGTTMTSWNDEELSEIMRNPSGSHVFRACLAALAGLPDDEPKEARLDDSDPGKIRSYIDMREIQVPGDWLQSVSSIGVNILESKTLSIEEMLWNPASCTALQALLSALAVANKPIAQRIGEKAMGVGFDRLAQDGCGSRFLERLILVLGHEAVKSCTEGRLAEYAHHPKANFCVQRILLSLKGRGQVMWAWDELESSISRLLGRGTAREGVVLALLRVTEAEGDDNCRRRASRAVIKAIGAVGSKTAQLSGILAMGSEGLWEKWRSMVKNVEKNAFGLQGKETDQLRAPSTTVSPRLLGTLMARCLIRFPGGAGQSARDSMATLSSNELLSLVADPVGSRLVEQWVAETSKERSSKNAIRVLKAIQEHGKTSIPAVARNAYGAMVLVKCISYLPTDQRKKAMDSLSSQFELLKKHRTGQIVIRKCRVEQYMRREDRWEREETARETRERLFVDIIEDDHNPDTLSGENFSRKRRDKHGHRRKQQSENSALGKTSKDRSADLAPVLGAIQAIAHSKPKEGGASRKKRKLMQTGDG
ncbi:Pumilio-like [Gracilariopsis chorda]|uniref:Pumilio-like n=1 Tax=Gracilariopsis chorda TaxID=448386 RepID=A0A2V3IY06_9FLOR|nr:Pumilio-like [Gracilariopsis chorda]|eukprot:PXF47032.1 Pumilio-like [Gracilariopsis chorda]